MSKDEQKTCSCCGHESCGTAVSHTCCTEKCLAEEKGKNSTGHACCQSCGKDSPSGKALDGGSAVPSATCAVYRIANMDCPVEEALIRKKLAEIPGITKLEFNLMQRVLAVHHELPCTAAIEAALKSIDMMPEPMDANRENQKAAVQEPEIPWKKLMIAGGFAALSEGAEIFHEWGASSGSGMAVDWLAPLPLIFAVIAIALSGLATYRKGWIALSSFELNINALMSVAVTGAVLIGQFPEAAMVMVLFNISEALEAKAMDKARHAIGKLLAMAPERATVLQEDGSWKEMDVQSVAVGRYVRVKPGEKIALDGLVCSGRSMVNQAPITGESMPVEKKQGDAVFAGTINESGSLEFCVTASSENSTLARIIHAVEEAEKNRAPVQRFVDIFARYYTPAVFLAALAAALVPPLFFGSAWMESLYTALVILVIGCPCALVISTPICIVGGMAAATRHGILIKGGMFLEQGRRLSLLAMDKTGTITCGTPRRTDVIFIGDESREKAEALAASLAALSDHPVSRAIAQAAEEEGAALLPVEAFSAMPGRGTSGMIGGKTWFLGSRAMLEEQNLCSEELEKQISSLERQGKTVAALAGEGGVLCLMAVADTVKESSLQAIRELKSLGVKTMMLTGDNEHTAQSIAAQVGVDEFRAQLLPEEKLSAIEQMEKHGESVGMVGDGINDAPALARARIGFAMAGAGSDTAIESADVAIMDDDLRKIPRFIRLSGAVHRVLMQNIVLALGVKALFFALAFTGGATMWMAVFADVGTTLFVVANGLRVMRM